MLHSTLVGLAITISSLTSAYPHQEHALNARTEIIPEDLTAVIYPAYADPPDTEGAWVGCDFGDDDCGCTNPATGLETYCGFIDPSWSPPDTAVTHGRRLSEYDGGEDPSDPDDANLPDDPTYPGPLYDNTNSSSSSSSASTTPTPTFGGIAVVSTTAAAAQVAPLDPNLTSRDLIIARQNTQEIVSRVKLPLIAALSTIGFNAARTQVTNCIRTKLPKAAQKKYVQGIKGTLGVAKSLQSLGGSYIKFSAAAVWEIRWDWSGKNADGSMPASGILGPHVNMVVQEGANRIKWAFYFPQASGFWSLIAGQNADQGTGSVVSDANSNYAQIVARLTNLAMYVFNPSNPAQSQWQRANDPVTGEANAAQAIAQAWHSNLESYIESQSGLKRRSSYIEDE